jgi:N-acetyl-alpha-D-muramate 1-phosphate uridylyltransferase
MLNSPRAMILAAGLGTRMRPLTDDRPKPLVQVAGRALIDHVLDRLQEAGVEQVVVNVHYCADMLESHLAGRRMPRITVSDERARLLDSGGGVKKALPHLGGAPFFVLNADSIWQEHASNLTRLASRFDETRMDALLMLAPSVGSLGYDGSGDFDLGSAGHLLRRREGHAAPYVYTGAAILAPAALDAFNDTIFSLNRLFDRAIASERLYGLPLEGRWMHIGTPEAVQEAEACILSAKPRYGHEGVQRD